MTLPFSGYGGLPFNTYIFENAVFGKRFWEDGKTLKLA